MSILSDFWQLLYPDLCYSCGTHLVRGERLICLHCRKQIPKTDFFSYDDNPVSRLFYGRVQIEHAATYCTYDKGGVVQKLMHQLKYKNRPEIGVYFGRLIGQTMNEYPGFSDVDFIIPIPLHPKKLRIRGYNQSRVIADGVAEVFEAKISEDVLVRKGFTETQTRKNRWERYRNVKDMFGVNHPEKIAGKHVLLVDDVITTGATIEACAKHLIGVEGVRVSIAGIASPAH